MREREERDGSCILRSVGDAYVGDSLRFVANDAIHGERPPAISRVLLVHAGEALCPADAFIGLRPIEHKPVGENDTNGTEVVGGHELPKPTDNFYSAGGDGGSCVGRRLTCDSLTKTH